MDELVLEGVKVGPHPPRSGLCLMIPMVEVGGRPDPDAAPRPAVIEGCGVDRAAGECMESYPTLAGDAGR